MFFVVIISFSSVLAQESVRGFPNENNNMNVEEIRALNSYVLKTKGNPPQI